MTARRRVWSRLTQGCITFSNGPFGLATELYGNPIETKGIVPQRPRPGDQLILSQDASLQRGATVSITVLAFPFGPTQPSWLWISRTQVDHYLRNSLYIDGHELAKYADRLQGFGRPSSQSGVHTFTVPLWMPPGVYYTQAATPAGVLVGLMSNAHQHYVF